MGLITDEKVLSATGKSRTEWFKLLDSKGAKQLEHKEIVKLLFDGGLISSGWWCQMITNEYEKYIGRRTLGSTTGSGFQVGVQRTLPLNIDAAWKLINSNVGLKIWLGEISELKLAKGAKYKTEDGTEGEIRSYTEKKHIRMTVKPRKRPKPTTLQLYLQPSTDGIGTALLFHQEKLSGAVERTKMKKHWSTVLEKLQEIAKR